MSEQPHFLATPKGVFLMGLVVGAMAILSLGFVLTASGALSFSRAARPIPAAPSAPTPPAAPSAPAAPTGTPSPVTKADHVRGTGPVTVIEYADYECPFCREFHQTMQQIMTANAGKVRWVFRHFPLTSIHPDAEPAAEAAECAGDQGKFWEMTDAIYANQSAGLSLAQLKTYASQSGVKDLNAWNTCVTTKAHLDLIQSEAQEATSIGAEGTPYSVVLNAKGNSQEIPGALPVSNVQAIIDALSK